MGAVEAAARPAPTPLFVGRDEELSCLRDALRRAAAGRPGMVLLAGEAGVGKSRLVARFAEQASRAGAVVAVGGAAPLTGGALPYAPLLQALRAAEAACERGVAGRATGRADWGPVGRGPDAGARGWAGTAVRAHM